jgi:hypothetical protein
MNWDRRELGAIVRASHFSAESLPDGLRLEFPKVLGDLDNASQASRMTILVVSSWVRVASCATVVSAALM